MSGFTYEFECVAPDGSIKWTEKVHNMLPIDGINYILGAALDGVARYTTWYVGLYTNNYTPQSSDTMTTFAAAAGETSNYDETTRVEFEPDAIAAGLFSNFIAPAEFTFNASTTVRGGFIASDSTKGGTSGLLLSAALFTSPRTMADTEVLRVRGGCELVSV